MVMAYRSIVYSSTDYILSLELVYGVLKLIIKRTYSCFLVIEAYSLLINTDLLKFYLDI